MTTSINSRRPSVTSMLCSKTVECWKRHKRLVMPLFWNGYSAITPLCRFAAEMAAIRHLYIGLRVRYKYYKKNSRSGLAWSRQRADRGLSWLTSVFCTTIGLCVCVQNIIQIGWDLVVRGPKTWFGVKTENGQAYAWPSIKLLYENSDIHQWCKSKTLFFKTKTLISRPRPRLCISRPRPKPFCDVY